MTFSSLEFLIFFLIVYGVTALLCGKPVTGRLSLSSCLFIRHLFLLVSSYYFYACWNWKLLFLMIALSVSAHYFSLLLAKTGKKIYLWLGVALPLVVLGFFKYYNFFVDSFCHLFSITNPGSLRIILPVGISFYTFQSLSYVIDVYRGEIPAEKSFLKTALYIAFFPQLVAGPIVKAKDFIHQLYEDRTTSLKQLEEGLQYFVFGLFKKMVLADNLSVAVDAVFECPSAYHAVSIIAAIVAYSIQIYCDFSGYSDMAIGCAKCLGYDLKRNFDIPYIARNISEFWKRWHISLSTWLMEYLYIPLGGNRKGQVRTYINLFLTMLIGGLWHGAAWTFVAWGAIHGTGLAVHKLYLKLTGRSKRDRGTLAGRLLSGFATYLFVCFCWIFFRADNFTTAWQVIRGVALWQNGILFVSSWTILAVAIVAIATLAAAFRTPRAAEVHGYYPTVKLTTFPGLLVLLLILGVILGLAYTGNNPFIYFQF